MRRPVPLCGCVPADDKYKAKPGSHVSTSLYMYIERLHATGYYWHIL